MRILSHLLPAILFSTSLFDQDNVNIKFGNVSPENFTIKKYLVIGSHAVIQCDSGLQQG
jgi:hypothetical protein